jgi:hypothetical protein
MARRGRAVGGLLTKAVADDGIGVAVDVQHRGADAGPELTRAVLDLPTGEDDSGAKLLESHDPTPRSRTNHRRRRRALLAHHLAALVLVAPTSRPSGRSGAQAGTAYSHVTPRPSSTSAAWVADDPDGTGRRVGVTAVGGVGALRGGGVRELPRCRGRLSGRSRVPARQVPTPRAPQGRLDPTELFHLNQNIPPRSPHL